MGNCCGGEAKPAQAVPGGKPLLRNKTQRLTNWRATGVVALRDANLKDIPDSVAEVGAAARTLDATNNRIAALPDFVFIELLNLQRLVLAANRLSALPPSIGRLTNLKVLNLDGNVIPELPEQIGQLACLEKLSACGNALTALPASLGRLTCLRELGVSGNKLRALPGELGDCASLEVLDAGDNYIQAIPSSLGRLQALQALQLDGNRVSAVPPELLAAPRLSTLSLHGNPITPEALHSTPGWDAFDARRRAKFDKKIAGNLAIGPRGLDEGVDRDTARKMK